jgi:hypothetical protein
MLAKGMKSHSIYSCVLCILSYIKSVCMYVCHMSGCFEMLYCLCSRLVKLNLIEQTQHTNNKQYNNSNKIK